jgi:hypothetical protein
MNDARSDGWDESAAGWLAEVADGGDYGRKFVLDAPMLARIKGRGFKTALDVGCGEGRFCRMLRDERPSVSIQHGNCSPPRESWIPTVTIASDVRKTWMSPPTLSISSFAI